MATTYYIKTGGNNALAGTSPATAWATAAKMGTVIAAGVSPGDQFLFNGGDTFTVASYIGPAAGGAAGNPIIIGSYGTGKATLSTPSPIIGGMFYLNAGYTTIQDLVLSGSGKSDTSNSTSGMQLTSSASHCQVLRCEIKNFSNIGINSAGDYLTVDSCDIHDVGTHCLLIDQTTGIEISNNTLHAWSSNTTWESGGRHAIYFEGTASSVHHNEIYSPDNPASSGQGVSMRRANQRVYSNNIHDMYYPVAFFNYEGNSVSNLTPGYSWFYKNRCWNIAYWGYYIDGSPPAVRVGGPGSYKNTVDLAIVNNTFHFASGGNFAFAHDNTNVNIDASTLICNNIVTGTPFKFVNLAPPTRVGKSLFERTNLFFGNTNATGWTYSGVGYTTLAAYQSGTSQGAADLNVTPSLADNGPGLASTATSPFINQGITNLPVATGLTYSSGGTPDYLYVSTAPEFGAVEYTPTNATGSIPTLTLTGVSGSATHFLPPSGNLPTLTMTAPTGTAAAPASFVLIPKPGGSFVLTPR